MNSKPVKKDASKKRAKSKGPKKAAKKEDEETKD